MVSVAFLRHTFAITPHLSLKTLETPCHTGFEPSEGCFKPLTYPSLTSHSKKNVNKRVHGLPPLVYLRELFGLEKYVVSELRVRRLRTLSPCPTYRHFALIILSESYMNNSADKTGAKKDICS